MNIRKIALSVLVCNVMSGSAGKCGSAAISEQASFGPELVELCMSGVQHSPDVEIRFKRMCPHATADGVKSAIRILVTSFVRALVVESEVGSVSKSAFPCLDMLEILELEFAYPEFLHKTCVSVPHDEAYEKLLLRYQRAVRNSSNSSEKIMLSVTMRTCLDRLISAYRDYKNEFSAVVRATNALTKLELFGDVPFDSLTEVEKAKLMNEIKTSNLLGGRSFRTSLCSCGTIKATASNQLVKQST